MNWDITVLSRPQLIEVEVVPFVIVTRNPAFRRSKCVLTGPNA